MTRYKIIISGGGIAGLTAALCLAKAGHRVNVSERSTAPSAFGAGIQISPNAFHVLKTLGLSGKLLSAGTAPSAIMMMNAMNGKNLARLPLGFDIEDIYGAPYLVLHRADLQTILFEACNAHPDITMTYGAKIIDAAIHENGATVMIEKEGSINEHLCDILIGAEGIHSCVRHDILDLPKAVYTGKIAWRALIPANQVKLSGAMSDTYVWLGSKAHAVTYPVRNGEYLNIIAVTQERDETKAKEISSDKLLNKFAHWSDDFKALLELEADWSGWPLYETRHIDRIAERSVALIGDAAHAMLPFAAQGAAQAIEDAAVLSKCLSNGNQKQDALNAFEKARLSRVKRVVKTARRNGQIYHLSGIAAMVRNLGISNISGEKLLAKQDWIYRWKV
jgi:salicylate hydroxylase